MTGLLKYVKGHIKMRPTFLVVASELGAAVEESAEEVDRSLRTARN